MRRALVVLGAAVLALVAGILVSLLLLGPASGGDERVGRLNPRQPLPAASTRGTPPPTTTQTQPTVGTTSEATTDDHGGGDDD